MEPPEDKREGEGLGGEDPTNQRDLQFTSSTNDFSPAEQRLKTVTVVVKLYHRYRTKRGQGEVFGQRRPKNYRK